MSTLGIENIEHTNGTTAMTIDSTGRVLTPARPAFLAKKLGGSNVTSGTVDFETIVINVGNGYTISGTNAYKFTAPVAGLYQLQTFCLTTSNSSANDLQIRVNDVEYAQARADVSSAAHNTISMSTIASLSVGDTVQVKVSGGDGISAASGNYNNFSGFLIGAAS